MSVSKVQRTNGVPQFKTLTECVDFVADRNTTAATLAARSKMFKAQAVNAGKQLTALARDVTTDGQPDEPEPETEQPRDVVNGDRKEQS